MAHTRDDERARRICSLALEFMNAASPVPSSTIARSFYPDLSSDSFRRAFSRDREALAICGISVRELPQPTGESLWAVDADNFAGGTELSPLEAAALEVACRPLLEDPGFPLSDELLLALAKLTRAFAEAPARAMPLRAESRVFSTLRGCLMDGVPVRISYVDTKGVPSERTIAPYGFFELRSVRYIVAGTLPTKVGEEPQIRTYRVDRVRSSHAVEGERFSVPADFSVDDWRRLPFQLGETRATALFEVPQEHEDAARRAAGGQGTFLEHDGKLLWSVDVSALADAASWAVAHGILPVEPPELVKLWKGTLEGVVSHGA